MPFDKTQVKPEVADLLKVREWIEENGFSPAFGERLDSNAHWSGCGCYMRATREIGSTQSVPLLRDVLTRRFGEPFPDEPCGVFEKQYLIRHGITTTERALEIIDAAIARVS